MTLVDVRIIPLVACFYGSEGPSWNAITTRPMWVVNFPFNRTLDNFNKLVPPHGILNCFESEHTLYYKNVNFRQNGDLVMNKKGLNILYYKF